MENLKFNLKARGQFLKILLCIGLAYFMFSASQQIHVPKQVQKKFLGKTRRIDLKVVNTSNVTLAMEVASGIFLLYGLYLIVVAKTTSIDIGNINLGMSRGVFVRDRDALDLTGITDFQKERTMLDMMLGISRLNIMSRDKTHPVLKLRGVSNKDADLVYDHLVAYSNRSMVEYVQGHQERSKYNKQRGSQTPEPKSRRVLDDGVNEHTGEDPGDSET
jgi:uncharacterized membrane protein YdbT with pleckstrin-like domain